jgi:hypothetical protein
MSNSKSAGQISNWLQPSAKICHFRGDSPVPGGDIAENVLPV